MCYESESLSGSCHAVGIGAAVVMLVCVGLVLMSAVVSGDVVEFDIESTADFTFNSHPMRDLPRAAGLGANSNWTH